MTSNSQDLFFMKEALRLAAKGHGRTSPNPMVGAVVVQGETIVGRGYHQYVGGPHAEINALNDAGTRAAGATLYVTLEPCNHHGRTPPCTQTVLKSGISRVVVGMGDPNPHVEGGGADCLRHRGIEVEFGILETDCRRLNQAFVKYAVTAMPYVTLKAAATLDGRIAARSGDSRWISNERSRRFVHQMRCDSDAILVGVETALMDDPQLTARLTKKPPCQQPVRIVLDGKLRLPLASQLVKTAREIPVWIACSEEASLERESLLREAGVDVMRIPPKAQRIDLEIFLQELGRRQVTRLLVEGGARVLGAFLENGLADDFVFFFAPKILADPEGIPMVIGNHRETISEAMGTWGLKVRRFGEDIMISGRLREKLY